MVHENQLCKQHGICLTEFSSVIRKYVSKNGGVGGKEYISRKRRVTVVLTFTKAKMVCPLRDGVGFVELWKKKQTWLEKYWGKKGRNRLILRFKGSFEAVTSIGTKTEAKYGVLVEKRDINTTYLVDVIGVLQRRCFSNTRVCNTDTLELNWRYRITETKSIDIDLSLAMCTELRPMIDVFGRCRFSIKTPQNTAVFPKTTIDGTGILKLISFHRVKLIEINPNFAIFTEIQSKIDIFGGSYYGVS